MTLHFSKRNTKLNHLAAHLSLTKTAVRAFDLPAGFTCLNADICKTFANRKTGKIKQCGSVMCYAARQEGYLPTVRTCRWNNYKSLLACKNSRVAMAELIHTNIPKSVEIIRIHSSGDFFSAEYFGAWELVSFWNPNITFFGYTKMLDYALCEKPDNFRLVYSHGSTDDSRADELCNYGCDIPTCYIDEYPNQWEQTGLPVICGKGDEAGDFGYILSGKSFRIAIH
jgi:hypothetical protein